jgi:hypothetical protein
MAVGSMVFILREQDWIRETTGGLCDTSDVDGAVRRLVQFMTAGMTAPALEEEPEPLEPKGKPL